MILADLISESLTEPATAIAYHVSRRLALLFPDRARVEGCDYDFTLRDFAAAGHCDLIREEAIHAQFSTRWSDDKGVIDDPLNVWYEVRWSGQGLDVLLMEWEGGCVPHFWIMADSEAIARDFFEAVCAWNPEVKDELLVFDGGHWDENAGLFRAARGADFEGLVLRGSLKDDIRADLDRFFASRALYESLGAPWKRGLLLTGPPGNGKTHTIKALVTALGKPCLYVKSFKSEKYTEETNIRRIFERARRVAPCLIVLEDLDALVTDENRSFLLNELDGFAANTGIAIVATTNHPEALDPAIVARPSRFDRKYHFELPGPAERRAYIDRWARALPNGLVLDDAARDRIAGSTEGFSFAYLKELFLASILARAADAREPFEAIIQAQAAELRQQMASTRTQEA